jgi:hypothetical protein
MKPRFDDHHVLRTFKIYVSEARGSRAGYYAKSITAAHRFVPGIMPETLNRIIKKVSERH